MSIECWFCNKKQVDESSKNNIVYIFKKQSFSDKLKSNKNEEVVKKEKVIIGRCDDCFAAHEKCKRFSLFGIIPYAVVAGGIFMMFAKSKEVLISVVLMIGALGFGAVSILKTRYLKKNKIKALARMEVSNEQIKYYLSDGWYR